MRVQALLVLVVVVCAAVLPSYVYSWGDTGHSLTARLAMSLFSDKTAALMKEIVPDVRGDISQVSVASWPDTIRCATCPYPYTAAYHTVNLPYYQCHYNSAVDCGETGCADTAIQNYTTQLADASSTRIPRNESLKYVVHFIGDIHQPLHAGNRNDSNGNRLTALWFNGVVYPFDVNTTNLHSIWDTGIIETRITRDFQDDPTRYFQYLVRTLHTVYNHSMVEWRRCGDAPQSQQDNFNACSWLWIQESSALACSAAYLHTDGARMDRTTFLNLSDAYYHANLAVVELRLLQAGVRMAHVLNLIADDWHPGQPEPDMPAHDDGGDVVEKTRTYSAGVLVMLIVVIMLLAIALTTVLCLVRRNGLSLGSLFDRGHGSSNSYGGSDSLRTSLL